MRNYHTPMILNIFMVCVKISLPFLLPNVLMVQWLNIWVNYMLFFMILMNYCLLVIILMLLGLHGLSGDYSHVHG